MSVCVTNVWVTNDRVAFHYIHVCITQEVILIKLLHTSPLRSVVLMAAILHHRLVKSRIELHNSLAVCQSKVCSCA